jgi:maspardin
MDDSNPHFARLAALRASHEPRTLRFGGIDWRYLAAGTGEPVLLLPGALRRADSVFDSILDLEGSHRVLAVEYPLAPTMSDLLAGIREVLRHESVDRTAVIGRSFGGIVAQCLVRACPEVVSRIALCHTTAPSGKEAAKNTRTVRRMLKLMPRSLATQVVLRQLDVTLTTGAALESAAFWRWYLADLASSGFGKPQIINHLDLGVDALERHPFAAGDLEGWPGKVLLVLAEDDPATPSSSREEIARLYPTATLRLFADGGHNAAHRHPEEYRAAIEAFLSA